MPRRRGGSSGKKAPTLARREEGFDALPDVILQHILGQTCTCVLARRWREQWKSVVRLLVNGDDFDEVEELRIFMEHLLLLRGGAPLETCELRFGDITDEYDDIVRANLWFRHAIRCQAGVVRLVNSSPDEVIESDNLRLVSQHLMELELAGVEVLKCALDLSRCPALEKLKMDNCDLSRAMNISSASLKRLSITGCEFSPKDVGNCGNCDSGDCDVCLGIIRRRSNCVLLEDLSKVKNLALMSESKAFISQEDLKRCPTFTNLKTLLLSDYWCVTLNMDALTRILNHGIIYVLQGPYHQVEMKGSYSSIQRSAGISEHLRIVEVKFEQIDARVLKVLKLLCTFNIRKITSPLLIISVFL
ncbi:hypothetical protein PVAP13_7NG161317 [Panicum virgatum]|uniref:Uncharacterized protein n=1 Tax=Panicum virgatum TaxID=38727 RepID=A0A8T0Q1Z0_PANVG|nr:hypothetical protein PVAP13_7NG161317 [Panicum virgatum]